MTPLETQSAGRCAQRPPQQGAARAPFALAFVGALAFACFTPRPPLAAPEEPPPGASARERLWVTATAYNSTPAQTDATPTLAAWGAVLRPGMQIIAVSRDLEARGLGPGTRVRIEGLPGVWEVADRMPSHRQLAIDVYMGLDVAAAREFGKRRLQIEWHPEDGAARASPVIEAR
jgi:hypothetical protein